MLNNATREVTKSSIRFGIVCAGEETLIVESGYLKHREQILPHMKVSTDNAGTYAEGYTRGRVGIAGEGASKD